MDQVQRNPIGSQSTNSKMASKGKLTLYVDIVSPFAYMAYHLTRVSATYRINTIELSSPTMP